MLIWFSKYLHLKQVGFFTGFVIASWSNGLFAQSNQPVYDRTDTVIWPQAFELVQIHSPIDDSIQWAYFYKSTEKSSQPLIISLHTWSGDYRQEDPIATLCLKNNFNYIHPDFRGSNNKPQACCSQLALSDIDEAITFALSNSMVKPNAIYLIGVSGGGYAALSVFIHSKHAINKFSVWVPISDLEAWYHESSIRKNKYATDILDCTHSINGILNRSEAQKRSPLFNKIPVNKLSEASLFIHTGVFDGIQGSVPITQTLNFYNRLLVADACTTDSLFVSSDETLHLIEKGTALGNFGKLGDRDIFLLKKYKNTTLYVFDGNHEMLPEVALQELLSE